MYMYLYTLYECLLKIYYICDTHTHIWKTNKLRFILGLKGWFNIRKDNPYNSPRFKKGQNSFNQLDSYRKESWQNSVYLLQCTVPRKHPQENF